ncbi:MAG TPA: purine-nucleoside phosphorylase [Thermoanaerobaculia bacterium]|nr:purine-nucleoside phosphorylase [Thermoanaerobaculia bacterium]
MDTINRAVDAIRSRVKTPPQVGVVLGSGLGGVVDSIAVDTMIPYGEIPGAKAATVVGHAGQMIFGRAGNLPVVLLSGRMHFYEGYEMSEVMLLSRIIGRLGIKRLIVTNAAGGVNTSFSAGDLMLISDHINFMGVNPLRGPNIDELGVRFPDMSEAYSEELRKIARDAAKNLGLTLREGVYLALSGPTYETPAEIRAFRTLGADAVGMSTVPEVIAMAQMGIPVLGISLITNMAAGVLKQKLHHQEVMDTAARAGADFSRLIVGILQRFAAG